MPYFCLVNLQVNTSIGGVGKTMQNLSFRGQCSPCPSCRYVPASYSILSHLQFTFTANVGVF